MHELAMMPDRTEYQCAITLAGDRPIGGCRIHVEEPVSQRGSIGYILSPDHWGHGYATEAARLLLDFGLGSLGLQRIEALVEPRNHGSSAVLERIGMRHEGTLRGYLVDRGERKDAHIYSMLTSEWEATGA